MDQTWCPVCPVAVKGELLRCNEATAEQGLSLTIQDWEELQAKLVALLARQARNYTKGESDSVPVETAQALLDSICFTLGLDLEDPGERGRELLARDLAKELDEQAGAPWPSGSGTRRKKPFSPSWQRRPGAWPGKRRTRRPTSPPAQRTWRGGFSRWRAAEPCGCDLGRNLGKKRPTAPWPGTWREGRRKRKEKNMDQS